ncbi:MAG: hypothetical protein IKT44_00900 [Clostridia bacterium]|nr:hypothetical protein [Clostridia bacterium]
MENYMVIAYVNGVNYMTKVEATSEYNAEHIILDIGICGKHGYGVDGCMAYGREAMKTETFIASALNAKPISLEALTVKIEARNEEIRKRDNAEKEIERIQKQIKELEKQLEENKKILE